MFTCIHILHNTCNIVLFLISFNFQYKKPLWFKKKFNEHNSTHKLLLMVEIPGYTHKGGNLIQAYSCRLHVFYFIVISPYECPHVTVPITQIYFWVPHQRRVKRSALYSLALCRKKMSDIFTSVEHFIKKFPKKVPKFSYL